MSCPTRRSCSFGTGPGLGYPSGTRPGPTTKASPRTRELGAKNKDWRTRRTRKIGLPGGAPFGPKGCCAAPSGAHPREQTLAVHGREKGVVGATGRAQGPRQRIGAGLGTELIPMVGRCPTWVCRFSHLAGAGAAARHRRQLHLRLIPLGHELGVAADWRDGSQARHPPDSRSPSREFLGQRGLWPARAREW